MTETYRNFVERCPQHREILDPGRVPFIQYRVYEIWKPASVRGLLLAEAPPWQKGAYFYNPEGYGNREGLGDRVFRLLDIQESAYVDRLQKFMEMGFFLLDTIKCPLKKRPGVAVPSELIELGVKEFLEKEIVAVGSRRILVLGGTALKAVKLISVFSRAMLSLDSITELCKCGKQVETHDATLLFSVFPNSRNKKYQGCIKQAFDLLADRC